MSGTVQPISRAAHSRSQKATSDAARRAEDRRCSPALGFFDDSSSRVSFDRLLPRVSSCRVEVLEPGPHMSYRVRIEQVESRPLAVVRRRATLRELSTVVPAACGEVWSFIRANQVAGPGRHVAVYLDGQISLEVGVEITPAFVGDDHVVRSATPAGTVATVAHIGPYAGLADAHQSIQRWCKDHGHKTAGPNWEIYGHWTDDASQLRTDVFYRLKADRGAV
jgi:effector-binding domain-containing protein